MRMKEQVVAPEWLQEKMRSMLNAEYVLDNVFRTVENCENPKYDDYIYEELLDMRIVYKVDMGEGFFMPVNANVLAEVGIDFSELHEAALENERELNDYTIMEFENVMTVLTTKDGVQGARTILNGDALKEAYEKIGEEYYLLPSSIHEMILVPKSKVDSVDDLRAMVKNANATVVDEFDVLSDSVYGYSDKDNSLYIA